MQMAAGAMGITCQKLGEVEVFTDAGVADDVLLTFNVLGRAKIERLLAVARRLRRLAVVFDNEVVARGLAEGARAAGTEIAFLIECDTGFGRTGVQSPEAAAELAELADGLPGLRFAGLMTYPTLPESGPWLRAAREAIEARGLRVERVSAGGTPTHLINHLVGEVTEVRAGTYVYGDRSCIANGSVALEDCALRIRATVVSRPTPDRAILDSGSKTLTNDPAEEASGGGHGLIVEYPEARIYTLSEEHGHVDVSACSAGPEVGEVVTIVPNHACGCTNMHDEVVVHRGGQVVGVLPVAARGKLR
jgi:D-serine deaminase-like pyridoxal phosphate-dependent protein